MGRLRYGAIASLDGYIADADGDFSWATPDVEVHQHVNDIERSTGTYLYGRGMYEVMRYWADPPGLADEPVVVQDYARIWQGAEKVVYSATLDRVDTPATRLARVFDADSVRTIVAGAERDVSIAGPTLAAHALRAGVVDEVVLYVCPVVVGSGTRWLPADLTVELALRDVHRFTSGTVFLRYDVRH
ncbi:MAG: dihydrofolate reductase family protein [Candidatus Nanopelagicales bacterium]